MGMPWGPWGLRVVRSMATNCLCSRQNLGRTEVEFHTMRTRIDFLTHLSDSTAEFSCAPPRHLHFSCQNRLWKPDHTLQLAVADAIEVAVAANTFRTMEFLFIDYPNGPEQDSSHRPWISYLWSYLCGYTSSWEMKPIISTSSYASGGLVVRNEEMQEKTNLDMLVVFWEDDVMLSLLSKSSAFFERRRKALGWAES